MSIRHVPPRLFVAVLPGRRNRRNGDHRRHAVRVARSLSGVSYLRRAAVVLAILAVAFLPGPARADGPLRLSDQLTDKAGVLGTRAGEARAALDELRAATGLQLFVVFVHSFDGTRAQDWTERTATRSDLGDRDALLAVATRDRSYAYSFDQAYPLSDAQLSAVAQTAIEPALARNDWAGAVVAAANGYRAALAGQPIPTPVVQPGPPDTDGGGGPGGGLVTGLVAVGVVGVAGAGGYALYRRRRRAAAPADAGPGGAPAGPPQPTTEELSARANSLLIDLDNELRGSEQELEIARGQYGGEATAAFTAALEDARREVAEAFRLRMTLDEPSRSDRAAPADEPATRVALTEIIRRCEEADRRLDAEADAFDRLREIEPQVERMSTELGDRRAALAARVPAAESTVDGLRQRYVGEGIATVAGNPAQARERLGFAAAALTRAGEAVAGGRRAEAALAVRAAEEALGQVDTLLAAVDQAGRDLDAARTAVDALLAEVESEITATRSSGPDTDGTLAAAAAAGTEAVAAVRAGRSRPTTDPQADLRRLQEADAVLDKALAASREAAQRDAKARARLDRALPAARAEVAAAGDYLTTRRGALGAQPRTLLAEAQRQLARAEGLATSDPAAALTAAQDATRLAQSASQAARTDVDSWSSGAGSWGGGGGGGDAFLGALLGGILAGGGRSRGGWGGGGSHGGGGWGGGWGGGFGGSGSRSGRGGGGRF
jgi:uncharacterized membrane protein YgcG